MRIRPATPADRPACYAIAVATGDRGTPAAHLHAHPDLIGEVYVGPYLRLASRTCLVVDEDGVVTGYALGVADTEAFAREEESRWWPAVRRRTADLADPTPADRALLDQILRPATAPAQVVDTYPAHGHIDLLPRAQGRGWGRLLMSRLMVALAETGATGMHLGVDPANTRALAFYARLGFVEVLREPGVVYVARLLRH